jgi:hypothetical protein
VTLLGRLDRRVKVRGVWTDPAVLEAALDTHPRVVESCVVARPEGLIAYVVLDRPAPSARELREHLMRTQPTAWIPRHVVPVAELPRSGSGKVDRSRLPEPAVPEAPTDSEPATETEKALAAMWSDALGGVPVGRGTDVFDLGADSLHGTAVAARIRRAFGIELEVRTLIACPTIAELAAAVDTSRPAL